MLRALSLVFLFSGTSLVAQVSQVEFGKNRVQYHQDFDQWLSYESQNFITYWYGKSRNAGQKAAQLAESVYEDVVKTLEFRINDKIELIVYVDITDMKQSNIGSEEILSGRTGQTKIERNKIFIYFDGDHRNLERQIRQGIAGVLLNYMLFGTEIQEIMQNMVALGLPDWFVQGLISYAGTPWDHEADNALRDALSMRPYRDFEHFARDYPLLAGHLFWFHVGLFYGKSEISNLVYTVRINKNIENGVRYVFGTSYSSLLESTWTFMQQLNARDLALSDQMQELKTLPVKSRRDIPVTKIAIHPNLPLIAYASNNQGRIKIYIHDLNTGKNKLIVRKGYKNNIQETDYDYPSIAWSPSGTQLGYVYESRDKIYVQLYNINTGKKETQLLPNRYQRVYSMDFWDEQNLVFAASENSFSDLYIYRLRNRQSLQLTNDIFDDKDATVGMYNNEKGIFFSSNRNRIVNASVSGDSIIPLDAFNLYFLSVDGNKDTLVRITHAPSADHRLPKYSRAGRLYFMSDELGIRNRKYVDLTQQVPAAGIFQTDYPRNIRTFDVQYGRNISADVLQYRNKPMVLMNTLAGSDTSLPTPTMFYSQFRSYTVATEEPTILRGYPGRTSPLKPVKKAPVMEENPDYLFQTRFDDPPSPDSSLLIIPEFNLGLNQELAKKDTPISLRTYDRINPLRIVPYRLKFRIDYVSTTMDNNPLFGGLESYAGTGEVQFNNPLGLLFKANFKDLFEDYQIEAGLRIPTAFNGAEYYILMDDKKRRFDKRYALYRRANYRTEGFFGNLTIRSKTEILLGMFELRYPIDVFTSLRAAVTLRQDRFAFLASELVTLNEPPIVDQRVGLRLEYVFDNTLVRDLNLLNGTRYKFYGEMVKRFQIQFLDQFNFDLGQGFMTILGVDARHYQPLGRHIVLAVRAAAATSFGSEKILYLLGGADNPLFPRFNDNIPMPGGDAFAFQTLAPNIRGFDFNIRNGNSFALVNTELRIPILQMLFRRPLRSNFFRHLQLVGFVDAGTAWQGFSPYDKDNPLNTIIIDNSPTIVVKVNYFRDPIVMGYGVGLRTMLFGYFIRVDYARGVDTRTFQTPKFHFSMGLDF